MVELPPRKATLRKSSDAAAQAERRDKFVREENAKARASSAEKTAKLRALRLAKEAADREAEQNLDTDPSDSAFRLIPRNARGKAT